MAWRLCVYLQERGTKKEKTHTVDFSTRDAAVTADEKIAADRKALAPDEIIVVDSGTERISFVSSDFRSTNIFDAGGEGPAAFVVAPRRDPFW